MPTKKTSSKKPKLLERLVALDKANVLVIGSSAWKKSLLRGLRQSGIGKIFLVDADRSKQSWMPASIEKSVRQANVVIDALSDWQKKQALSDICMDCERTLIHCGVTGFRFQIYTMIPGRSACLRCALPLAGIDEVPLQPTNEETMDAVIELAAAWQSLETVKCLAKIGVVQGNELFKFDCLSGELEIIRGLDANRDCPDCGRKIARHSRN